MVINPIKYIYSTCPKQVFKTKISYRYLYITSKDRRYCKLPSINYEKYQTIVKYAKLFPIFFARVSNDIEEKNHGHFDQCKKKLVTFFYQI